MWQDRLRRLHVLVDAPELSRAEKSKSGPADPKWAIGDLLTEVPDHLLGRVAGELGETESELRRYRDVAAAWPSEYRVAASWSTHRDLKDLPVPRRYETIRPGMTVREAAVLAGKKPIDAKPVHRLSLEERADHVVGLLMDKQLNEQVLKKLEDRRAARRTRRAARMANDERSAEFKEAMRSLRQAQATKSPEVAFLEVVFKLQESAEYVRAVLTAATDSEARVPLVPEHRKPDLICAIETLVDVGHEALDVLKKVPLAGRPHDAFIEADIAKPRPELLEPRERAL